MPLFQLILVLTLLIVLIIIQRLYHGLRILNSRVDILSSLLKNLKEDFRREFQHHTEDTALQEYLHNESILQAKMSRDFSYQVPKKPSLRGQNLMRSDIHDSVPHEAQSTKNPEESDNKSRFKRHPSFSIPAEIEKSSFGSTDLVRSQPITGRNDQDPITHTLSQSHIPKDAVAPKDGLSWDASPTLLSGQTLQPTEPSTHTVEEHTQNPLAHLSSPHSPLQNTPTALEHLTFQDVTYKKLSPPDPERLVNQEENLSSGARVEPSGQGKTISPAQGQGELTQRDAHPFESLTIRKESEHPGKPTGLSRLNGLFEQMEQTVDTAISTPLTAEDTKLTVMPPITQDTAISPPPAEPDTAVTARLGLHLSTFADTTIQHDQAQPTSPSQENLLSTYQIGEEGSELRIKKDLSYVVKTSPSGANKGENKPVTVEQIPSLSFLSKKKDQGS